MGRRGCEEEQEAGCGKGINLRVKKKSTVETNIDTYPIDKSQNFLSLL